MLKPFQKSHNTAFRLLTVLLYGPEAKLPYLTLLKREGRRQLVSLRTGVTAKSLRMTIPRLKEHLAWLVSIGLILSFEQTAKGLIVVTLLLPENEAYANEP
jgi:hypothetical protein